MQRRYCLERLILLKSDRLKERAFKSIAVLSAFIIVILMLSIVLVLLKESSLALKQFGFKFFISSEWDPVFKRFGALPSIYGTIVTSLIAIIIALPLSIGIAIFITEIAPLKLRNLFGGLIETLAGIPSIIYGIWGLFVLVPIMAEKVQPFLINYFGIIPIFSGTPMGIGVLTAGIILALMIIPFISSVTRDVFLLIPPVLKESGYALGATRWEVLRNIVFSHAKTGIISATFLGLGRALGETMAVTFVIGNAHSISPSIIEPGTTISATLANEFTEATGDLHLSSLIALGLILFLITLIISSIAKFFLRRSSHGGGV